MSTGLRTISVCGFLLGFCAGADTPVGDGSGLAPRADYEGKAIRQIQYDPALQPITPSELARRVTLHPDQPLRLDDVRSTIRALYATGRYAAIDVAVEPAAGGVTVVFRTREQWFVGPVEVRGKFRKPPTEGEMANTTRLDLGTPLEEDGVKQGVTRIRELLERNGYYLNKVEPQVERDFEHQQVAITFQVDTEKRAKLTEPQINGDTRLPPEDVAHAAKYRRLFRWKQATDSNVQEGLSNIRNKYDSKDRLTASVKLDRREYLKDENKVRPVITADGGPKVKIETSGAKVRRGTLKKYVPVFDVQTVNNDLLVLGASNLRDYFQNKGYFDVRVDFQTRQVNPDEEIITYTIAQGQRRKMVNVDVRGNRYFTTDDIRERMLIQPAGFLWLRHGRFSHGFLKRDEEAIRDLYTSNGFLDVRVTGTTVNNFRGKAGNVGAQFTVEEGPQYLVASIQVDGLSDQDRARIVPRLACISGQPYSDTNVALDRDRILADHQGRGYPDVRFDWSKAMDRQGHRVSLVYHVTPGERRYVRGLLFAGLRETNPRLIAPAIQLSQVDPLSLTKMGFMQRDLYELGVFDQVNMAIQNPDGDTQEKYAVYQFVEGHRVYLAVGAGAEVARIGGSQTSLANAAGQTGLSPRASFEASRLNLWGLGHSLNFKSRYSTLDRQVSLNYLAPRYHNIDGRNISITGLYDNTRDVRTFTARRLEGSAQISQKYSKATTLLFRYTWRDVQVDQNTLKINPLLIPTLSQPAKVALLSTSIIQDRRDNPTEAHRGIYNTVDLALAERYFGGNKNFLRFLGRNSYYKQIGKNNVLASNTQFGVIKPFGVPANISNFDYMPLPERFFGGGSLSHRGFPDNQAGPRDLTTGFPLGGNALLFHSTELRFPMIGDNITGVLFHDMGNVYTNLSSISFRVHQKNLSDFDYMVHAVGFGIRYRTPVGPIRLDLAYSINPPRFNGLSGTYQDLINNTATPGIQRVSRFQFFFSIGEAF